MKVAEIVVLCYETGNPRDEPSWRGRTMNSLWAVFHHLLCQTVMCIVKGKTFLSYSNTLGDKAQIAEWIIKIHTL